MRRAATGSVLLALSLALIGCRGEQAEVAERAPALFEQVASSASGVTFANTIREDLQVNILSFEYLYNGGGVAAGDVDGDGLIDLFFTATQQPNRLYLNRGEFRFEDVTEAAGVAGRDSSMTTGVTMADVNGDGLLDLYVCQTGKPEWAFDRRNLLYVNQGGGRFTEEGAAYGIDSESFSNQATFFDYDGDGDLDLYVINHPPDFLTANVVRPDGSETEPFSSDQLFRNDGGRFTEVTAQAGIGNRAFGLSATALDVDDDGDLDLYVANDYIQPDFLYRNNGDGTFTDVGGSTMLHTSHFGMGSDAGDIDNDGLVDVVVLDMMAEDSRRQKLLGSVMMFDRYALQKRFGYGEQVMRNTLHRNNGDGTFSEIGQLAGVSTTDWSWGPLLADLDNDGWRDLFVANGYRRDVTNLDYSQFTVDSLKRADGGTAQVSTIYEYLDLVPTEKLANYAYRNRGDLTFENVSAAWGLADATYSNGATYADLDNDGDLDLVVNDIDGPARLYRNRSDSLRADRHWLRVQLDGPAGNVFGIGARVEVATPDSTQEGGRLRQTATVLTTRGFYSSAPPEAHFGLGRAGEATVSVRWPDGRVQRLDGVPADQVLTVRYAAATDAPAADPAPPPLFTEAGRLGLDFEHVEDPFIDFKRDPLVPHMFSRDGPALAAADFDGDGLDDVFVGGAAGQAGALFLQTPAGRFQASEAAAAVLTADALREDTRVAAADFDGDGAVDLYVGSGGSHLVLSQEGAAEGYQDRLYLGDGSGGLRAAPEGALPRMDGPTGAVAAGDADGDGDLDLFVGGRLVPGRYPQSPRSYLLENDGTGRFRDVTAGRAPSLMEPGLVTGAAWVDLDGDERPELAVVGEWMPLTVWKQGGQGRWEALDDEALGATSGWWNSLAALDLDGDGDLDLLGGNLGLNSRVGGSADRPVRAHARDFDGNGSFEAVLTRYYPDGRAYPFARREGLTAQLPYLKRRFPRFGRYAASTLEEVFPGELEGALVREAAWFETTWFENVGGRLTPYPLPIRAQIAPIYAFASGDVDGDGVPDLILAGNNRAAEVERGPYDAERGAVLLGRSPGWSLVQPRATGLRLTGDVRGLAWVETAQGPVLVVANNDAPLQVYRVTRTRPPS